MDQDEPYPAEDAWYTQKKISIPGLYGGVDIESNGPHKYFQKTPIAKASSGVTKEMVFETLRRHATPRRRGDFPVSSGDETDIDLVPVFSPDRVKHHVFPEHFTVVNTTVKDKHMLHPGNVFRTVVQEGDDIYIVTQGYGTGLLPRVTERLAPKLWRYTDQAIRDEFSPASFDQRWNSISNAPPQAARPRLDLFQRPAAESSNSENSRRAPTRPVFNDRWDDLPPVETFDQRWGAGVPMRRLVDLGRPDFVDPGGAGAGSRGEYDYREFGDDEFGTDEFRRR